MLGLLRYHLPSLALLSLLATACGDNVGTPPTMDQGTPTDVSTPSDTSDGALADVLAPDVLAPDLLQPDQLRTVSGTEPVTFSHQEQPFQGVSYDTGWQPSGSPVQLRFSFSTASDVQATLPGSATLTRNTQLSLTYSGDPSGGTFTMDIGFDLGAKLKIDPLSWEGNLPLVPQFDFRFTDSAPFTPFVLEGATTRPVHLEDTKPKQKLFTVPIPGLSICLWGSIGCAGGVVEVNAGGTIKADLTGKEIATTLDSGPSLKHALEGETASCSDQGTDTVQASATYKADVVFSGTITIYPTVTITTPIPGVKWDLAEFPIPVDLSTFGPLSNSWTFSPQSLTFDME